MRKLLNWEISSFFKDRKFLSFLIMAVLLIAANIAIAVFSDVDSGQQALGDAASFNASLLAILMPVYSGVLIAQSFEQRLVQAEIMSGKKRLSVVVVKSVCFALLFWLYAILSTAIVTVVFTVMYGWGGAIPMLSNAGLVLATVELITLSVVGFLLVLPIAFSVRKQGATIGIGLAVSLILQGLTQKLIEYESLHVYLKLTPLGRAPFVFLERSVTQSLITLAVIVFWTALFIGLTYAVFRKVELK